MEEALITGHLQDKGNNSQPTLDHDLKIGKVYLDKEIIIKVQGKGTGATKLFEAEK